MSSVGLLLSVSRQCYPQPKEEQYILYWVSKIATQIFFFPVKISFQFLSADNVTCKTYMTQWIAVGWNNFSYNWTLFYDSPFILGFKNSRTTAFIFNNRQRSVGKRLWQELCRQREGKMKKGKKKVVNWSKNKRYIIKCILFHQQNFDMHLFIIYLCRLT